MRFDETNKVIIETMNEAEARAFVKFLTSEIARHRNGFIAHISSFLMQACMSKFFLAMKSGAIILIIIPKNYGCFAFLHLSTSYILMLD